MKRTKKRPAPETYALSVIPRSGPACEQWLSWFAARGAQQPPNPEDMILIADPRGLLCGVGLYPTAGPYVFAEHLSTNPAAPVRIRHRAVVTLLRALRAYCAMRAKYPILMIRNRSLIRMLTREGFTPQPAMVMSTDPVARMG